MAGHTRVRHETLTRSLMANVLNSKRPETI